MRPCMICYYFQTWAKQTVGNSKHFKWYKIHQHYFLQSISNIIRNSHQKCSMKKGVLRNFTKFTGKHLCQSLFLIRLQKETLAQVFSCNFCEISWNTFFTEPLWTTASVLSNRWLKDLVQTAENCQTLYEKFHVRLTNIHRKVVNH